MQKEEDEPSLQFSAQNISRMGYRSVNLPSWGAAIFLFKVFVPLAIIMVRAYAVFLESDQKYTLPTHPNIPPFHAQACAPLPSLYKYVCTAVVWRP
jgi:hypothetical protein